MPSFVAPTATIIVNIGDPRWQEIIAQAKVDGRFVLVDRSTKWGNPFSHLNTSAARFRVRTRAEAIHQHALWIIDQPDLMTAIGELYGKVLGCHCIPWPCHASTLARLALEVVAARFVPVACAEVIDGTPPELAATMERELAAQIRHAAFTSVPGGRPKK